MADIIPVLRVFDDDGNEYPIPAIQGKKGDKGDPGEGDMNKSVYDPQGIGEDVFARIDAVDNVFVATYGETTFAELEAAYSNGKALFLNYESSIFPMALYFTDSIFFVCRTTSKEIVYSCNRLNQWSETVTADLPVAHATRHGVDGDDPITPESIGAAPADHAHSVDDITGAAMVAVKYRTGDKKYGVDNPCSLTFDFAPKVIIWLNGINGVRYAQGTTTDEYDMAKCVVCMNELTTSYESGYGFGYSTTGVSFANLYAKKSADGKTVYWYSSEYTNEWEVQANASYRQVFVAFG